MIHKRFKKSINQGNGPIIFNKKNIATHPSLEFIVTFGDDPLKGS